ncbi:hypothetical protein TNCV_2378651 [Trichonephila clavipes]|uniref:Uncharacterized protein n=1 Tax=Trichonephila clavipes TaxID=2585209 RepID=A0A8X6RLD4_TRICX|nr:hypothetical protein TNCV_2378651 [Trichonephila clavipes]
MTLSKEPSLTPLECKSFGVASQKRRERTVFCFLGILTSELINLLTSLYEATRGIFVTDPRTLNHDQWYRVRTRDKASHGPIPIPLGYRGHQRFIEDRGSVEDDKRSGPSHTAENIEKVSVAVLMIRLQTIAESQLGYPWPYINGY